jgi:hypothetical protein
MKEVLSSQIELRENVDRRPYVVSADIRLLLDQWGKSVGYSIPDEKYFTALRANFSSYMKKIFPGYEMISESELTTGLTKLINTDKTAIISLDKTYYSSDLNIDVTRQTDTNGNNKGLSRRANAPTLLSQFRKIRETGNNRISLVDDVIFSGDVLRRIATVLTKLGLRITTIYAGIGIGEGVELLRNSGYNVQCVREFPEVIDEICERDFYPGVPLSGRLVDVENNIGATYILPFGKPREWASIPDDWQKPLSQFCIKQTMSLISEIERVSGKIVQCSQVARNVPGLPRDNTRFTDVLQVVCNTIEG